MATLDEFGREILDQTPVSLPIHYDRPEPIHQRIRRMVLEAIAAQKGEDVETFEDANDFEIPDDPTSFDTEYTEPDLDPPPALQYTPEEIAAAKAAVEALRASKTTPEPSTSPSVDPAPQPAPSEPSPKP